MLIHELYGIQSEQLESLRLEYSKLLNVVDRMSRGEIDPKHVTVVDNGWTFNTADDNKD